MTVRRFSLGHTGLDQYIGMTDAELLAWNNPQQHSYHSYHIERMGHDIFRFRDSLTAHYYIGTWKEVSEALLLLQLRKLDPEFESRQTIETALRLLSQEEVDNLLSDI